MGSVLTIRDLRALAWTLGALVLATPAACSSFGSDSDEGTPPAAEAGVDAAADVPPGADGGDVGLPDAAAPTPPCDKTKPFGLPVLVPGLRTTFGEKKGRLTPDELTIYFTSSHADGQGEDLWVATRTSVGDPFDTATRVTVLNTLLNESDLTLSADGTVAVFGSDRLGGQGQHDLWSSLHNAAGFGVATLVTDANDIADEGNPFIAVDGLWFTSSRGGAYTIWRSPKINGIFDKPSQVTELASGAQDFAPVLTADGLTIFFGSRRLGGFGTNDVWRAHRAKLDAALTDIANVTELNSAGVDNPSWISLDECRLYMESDREDGAGIIHIYVASRPPL